MLIAGESDVIAAAGGEMTEVKFSGELRWVPRSMFQAADLKLQQRYLITHYRDGKPFQQTIEWRDVPIETDG